MGKWISNLFLGTWVFFSPQVLTKGQWNKYTLMLRAKPFFLKQMLMTSVTSGNEGMQDSKKKMKEEEV